MTITEVRGREVLDSRGNPTVEVDVGLEGGAREGELRVLPLQAQSSNDTEVLGLLVNGTQRLETAARAAVE